MSFSWVPFYRELAGRVLEFEERQDELIAVLREMQDAGLKVVPIEDDLSRTERVLFTEIDPFTFMATFSRSGDKTAGELCNWIRKRWNLQAATPTDFNGRPNVAAVGGASWFFTSSELGRTQEAIPSLWKLAATAYQGGLAALTAEMYEECVMLKNVGVLKLTTGLFWFQPTEFLPLVGPMLPFLRQNGVKWDEKLLQIKPHCKFSEYAALIEKARAFNPDFIELSHYAWLGRNVEETTDSGKTDLMRFTDSRDPEKIPESAGEPFFTALQTLLHEHEREKGIGVPLKISANEMSSKLNLIGAKQLIDTDEWKLMSRTDQSRAMEVASELLGKEKDFPTNASWCGRHLKRTANALIRIGIDAQLTDKGRAMWTLRRTTFEETLEEAEFFLRAIRVQTTGRIKMPLNQILYGPPGTGKTYNSIRRAVQIIDGAEGANPKARFEELRKAGQIEFVTFHQSFSYEEFVEGLRPVIGDESGQVSYEIRAGILKKIALSAIGAGVSRVNPMQGTFDDLWSCLVGQIQFKPQYRIKGENVSYRLDVRPDGRLRAINIDAEELAVSFCSRYYVEKSWNVLRNHAEIDYYSVKKAVGDSEEYDPYLVVSVVKELQKYESSVRYPYGRQDVPEEAAYSLLSGALDYLIDFGSAKKFVLIIDEINRGNISKILGELITLLEDDKRIGAENELRLTLPTSGETFALPPNLYILGTMNTSDKSLAQLDVALRRRFSFEEMPPILSLCNQLDGLPAVLKELNDRLEWALDREHRLGHAYFMGVDSPAAFDEVFRSKIVPLLIEYFPHDFQTLRAVLGEKADGFLREMPKPKDFPGSGKKYRWWFESGDKGFSAFERLKSNYEL